MVNYPNTYWQAPTQMPNIQTTPTYLQQPQMMNTFSWVQGEEAAKSFVTQPGTTAILMDSENPVLYMKQTDQSGRPMQIQKRYLVTEEEYEKLQNGASNSEMVTKEEFEAAIDEIKKKYVIRKEFRNE